MKSVPTGEVLIIRNQGDKRDPADFYTFADCRGERHTRTLPERHAALIISRSAFTSLTLSFSVAHSSACHPVPSPRRKIRSRGFAGLFQLPGLPLEAPALRTQTARFGEKF